MQGLLGDDGGYDVGVEIGTSGLKTTDDIRSFTFTLDSSSRNLTLADFSNVAFGARITSVGLRFQPGRVLRDLAQRLVEDRRGDLRRHHADAGLRDRR